MLTEINRRNIEGRAGGHGALADPHRLAITDDLALSDRSPSELASRVGIGSNLLAHHLQVLEDAGLVVRIDSHGDRRRRYLSLRRDVLVELIPPIAVSATQVAFVCSANSARSQLAAALWNSRHPVPATSAGTEPGERVHLQAVLAARRLGLDLRTAVPRAFDGLERRGQRLVVTVCDRAHEQLTKKSSGELLHWSIPDPAAIGTPDAFDRSAQQISARIEGLAPFVSTVPEPDREESL
ncbi:MAG: helix-turn-helix domain-containing protein [Actinobacteria bacterium]|nr:helix-turn-helix domain-containing protein [Actinomycetota bacterium]